jgi:hypothetical protein
MAEVLGENQVRGKFLEAIAIYGINGFAALHVFTNEAVGFGRGGFFGEARGDYCGFGFCPEGEIAFVAYADDFFVEA